MCDVILELIRVANSHTIIFLKRKMGRSIKGDVRYDLLVYVVNTELWVISTPRVIYIGLCLKKGSADLWHRLYKLVGGGPLRASMMVQ